MDNKFIIVLFMTLTSVGRHFGTSSDVNGGFDYMTDIEEDSSFRIERGTERENSEIDGNSETSIEGSRNKNDSEKRSDVTDLLECIRSYDPPYFYFSNNKFLWKKTKENKDDDEENDLQSTSKMNGKKVWQWFMKKERTSTDNGKRARGEFDVLSSTSKESSPEQFVFVLDDEEKDAYNAIIDDESNSSIEQKEEDETTNTEKVASNSHSSTMLITPKIVNTPTAATTVATNTIKTTIITNTINNINISTQLPFVSAQSGRDVIDFESLMNYQNDSKKFVHNGTLPSHQIPTFDYEMEDLEIANAYNNLTCPIKEIQSSTSGKKLTDPFNDGEKPLQFFMSTDVSYLPNNSTAVAARKSFWEITDDYSQMECFSELQISSNCINTEGVPPPIERLNENISCHENVYDPFSKTNESISFSDDYISTLSSHLLTEPNGLQCPIPSGTPMPLMENSNGIYIPYYKGVPPSKVIIYDFMSKRMKDFPNNKNIIGVLSNKHMKNKPSAKEISDPMTFSSDFTRFIKNICLKHVKNGKLIDNGTKSLLPDINNRRTCLKNSSDDKAFNYTSDEIQDNLKEYVLLLGIVPYELKSNGKNIKTTKITPLETGEWDSKSLPPQSNIYKTSDENVTENYFHSECSDPQKTGSENIQLECLNNHSLGWENQYFIDYENITPNFYIKPENHLNLTSFPIQNFEVKIETLKFPSLKDSLDKTLIHCPTKGSKSHE